MKPLKQTYVRRYAATSYWNGRIESTEVTVDAVPAYTPGRLVLGTTIKSKGGGRTGINIEIGPQDFPKLLEHMTEADSEGCLSSMFEEIKRREILMTKRGAEDGYDYALDLMVSNAYQEHQKMTLAREKKNTLLRNQKESAAFHLEQGIRRIAQYLRLSDYPGIRRMRRQMPFLK